MKLQFLGATGTVTGSKYLLSDARHKVLVDCGLFQGYKNLRSRNWKPLPLAPSEVDAVLLTHAHLDHSGYLPLLVKNGFRGKILCTEATFDLCKIMLTDSGRLQEEEAAFANRHGYSKHKPALPLYSEADAIRALHHFSPVKFGQAFALRGDMHGTLVPAGHILGAAIALVDCGKTRVTFSGDLGRQDDILMMAPSVVEQTDYLVVESTYGDRLHPAEDPGEKLAAVINETAERGGVTLIPSFAVGRAQALMYHIHLLKARGAIPAYLPVYLNSPMAVDATQIYRRHREGHKLDHDACQAMCGAAHYVNSVEESIALNDKHMPMVIIAASGMATGGRVLHHLEAFAGDPRNTVLFTGFQAGGTRGAAMMAGADSIKIHGRYIPVRARVAALENLSAHADQAELLAWLGHIKSPPRQTFITHGEPAAAEALRRAVQDKLHWNAVVPEYLDVEELA